jgi:hypothetical protein
MMTITFRNFNLSRLLSSQVAPVRLGGEPSRSNAFLHFFEMKQIGRAGLFSVAGGTCAGGHYFLLLLCTSSQSHGVSTVEQSASAFVPQGTRSPLRVESPMILV